MVNAALMLRSGAFQSFVSYPDYLAYRDQMRSFGGVIAAAVPEDLRLQTQGGVVDRRSYEQGSLFGRLGLSNLAAGSETAATLPVSENYFSVLGAGAVRGRVFNAADAQELTASSGVLISENYWTKRFHRDSGIVGKVVRLNGAAFTIIGVTPHNFVGMVVAVPDFWMPLGLEPLVHPTDNWLADRETLRLHVCARLAAGATIGQAQQEMSLIADRLRSLHAPHADFAQPLRAAVWPGSPFAVSVSQNPATEAALGFVLAAVATVLVIACANAANLQLARASSRQAELAMRLSLGASRGRLLRQLLTESALLALIAGGLGFLLSWALLQAVVAAATDAFPEEYGTFIFHITPDLSVFAFVFFLSVLAGVLFGLAPAFESSRAALASALKAGASVSQAANCGCAAPSSRRRWRFRRY